MHFPKNSHPELKSGMMDAIQQFLLFVDGQAVQGQDMNHREVRLTDCAEAGRTYTLDLQAYTGILHNEFSLKVTAAETDSSINEGCIMI